MEYIGQKFNFSARSYSQNLPAAAVLAAGENSVLIVGPTHNFITGLSLVRLKAVTIGLLASGTNLPGSQLNMESIGFALEIGVGSPLTSTPLVTPKMNWPALERLANGGSIGLSGLQALMVGWHGDFDFDSVTGTVQFAGSSYLTGWRHVFRAHVSAVNADTLSCTFYEVWEDWSS